MGGVGIFGTIAVGVLLAWVIAGWRCTDLPPLPLRRHARPAPPRGWSPRAYVHFQRAAGSVGPDDPDDQEDVPPAIVT